MDAQWDHRSACEMVMFDCSGGIIKVPRFLVETTWLIDGPT